MIFVENSKGNKPLWTDTFPTECLYVNFVMLSPA